MSLILRELTTADEKAFLEGAAQWPPEELFWYSFDWRPGEGYQAMLQKLADNQAGRDLGGKVPSTMFYGFKDGAIIGRLNLRHALNDKLILRGGHIGYAVARPYRGNGYAIEMLKQSLPLARAIGLTKVLLTCADTNVASIRTIERGGGILQDKVTDVEAGELVRRYWITL